MPYTHSNTWTTPARGTVPDNLSCPIFAKTRLTLSGCRLLLLTAALLLLWGTTNPARAGTVTELESAIENAAESVDNGQLDERARQKAEREAKRKATQEAKAAERARQKAEREAAKEAREAEQQARRAEMEKVQQERREEREAVEQANAEAQEKACQRLETMNTQLDTLPPEVLARHFGGGLRRNTPATQISYDAWLLSDSIFNPAFGQNYDAIPVEEATQLQGIMRNCTAPRNATGQSITDSMLFFRAFDSRFQPKYLAEVKSIREAQAGFATLEQQLSTLPSNDAGIARWRELAIDGERLQSFVGPARRKDLQTWLRQAYQTVVLPAHAREAEQLAGQAQGQEGLRALLQLREKFKKDAEPVELAPDWPTTAKSRMDDITHTLAAAQRQRIGALGTGLTGLENGVRWHRDYRQQIEEPGLASIPELSGLESLFEQQRHKTLAAARPGIENEIKQAKTQAELQQVVERYIPLQSDAQSTEGRQIMAQVAAQGEKLHKQSVLESDGDRDSPVGPEGSVIYDIVNNQLKSIAAGVQSMAGKCGGSAMQNDPMAALMCVGGMIMQNSGADEPMTITSFKKLGCANANASGKTGFRCDYLVQTSGGV